jgi:hypothetical protein
MTRLLTGEPRNDAQQRVSGPAEPRTLAKPPSALAAAAELMAVRFSLALVGKRFALVRRGLPIVGEPVTRVRDRVPAFRRRAAPSTAVALAHALHRFIAQPPIRAASPGPSRSAAGL